MSALKPKQQRFVDEYLIDLNGTQAAIRAGYSAKTARSIASELLTKPDIQEAIKSAQATLAESVGVTPEKIVKEYARLAFSNMRDFATFGPDGIELKNLADMDPDAARCVAEISEGKQGLKFKLHDKKGALDSLAKHLGMFVDKTEVSGSVTVMVNKP